MECSYDEENKITMSQDMVKLMLKDLIEESTKRHAAIEDSSALSSSEQVEESMVFEESSNLKIKLEPVDDLEIKDVPLDNFRYIYENSDIRLQAELKSQMESAKFLDNIICDHSYCKSFGITRYKSEDIMDNQIEVFIKTESNETISEDEMMPEVVCDKWIIKNEELDIKDDDSLVTEKGSERGSHGDGDNIRHKTNSVRTMFDKAKEITLSDHCEECGANQSGGCKHAITFAPLYPRSSKDPPSNNVKCYWKQSKLSSGGTTPKFVKARDIGLLSKVKPQTKCGNLLTKVINHSLLVGHRDSQLTKYYKEFSPVEKVSIHYLINTMPNVKLLGPLEFLNYCRTTMNTLTCEEACQATKDQCNCPLWDELRYARISASKSYDAVHCKVYIGTLVDTIMGAPTLKDSETIKRRRMLKKEVLKEVEKKMSIEIDSCGLRLSETYPIIGTSPDGESTDYTVEIKCSSSEEAMRRYITETNEITAKYMAEMQLQMYFSQKRKALLCIANHDFETSKNVNILTINYNEKYCKDIIEKCILFWNKAIFPILIKNM